LFDFNSDNQFMRVSARVVALRQEKQSLQARQRDIYESHRHRAFSVAYYMTGNELEAEQILAGTFVTAFRAAEEPSAQDVDAALIRELKQRFPLQAEAAAPVTPSTDGFNLSGRNVKRTDLEEAIQELPAAERLLFLLRDVEGYTSAAIAGLLRVPEAQVNRRLFAARIHLRQAIAELQNNEEKAA
jgi:RNA polymerase sigma-70 factor (ECF subfamily)